MYWQETERPDEHKFSARVVDIAFRMECPCLPTDHSWSLCKSIENYLPWFADEEYTGIHAIHGAESNNGWTRPNEAEGALIHLSKRVKLVLRIPGERLSQCATMSGKTLTVAGNSMKLGRYTTRTINPTATLFARRIVTHADENEEAFLQRALSELTDMNVTVPKLLPGRTSRIKTPDRHLVARSLLLADLSFEDSIRIQESGLGESRNLGCGLFVPHKSITAVKQFSDE
ncbi:type I-MYXAN CRISPR-associated protein Cas6/Cmx6 [Gammaproteobacteria bacterium]|nr:type I-MYXAN CRISPR-associated protein Cas6/Cmx6 [Gammaproteobacteria bacterium]